MFRRINRLQRDKLPDSDESDVESETNVENKSPKKRCKVLGDQLSINTGLDDLVLGGNSDLLHTIHIKDADTKKAKRSKLCKEKHAAWVDDDDDDQTNIGVKTTPNLDKKLKQKRKNGSSQNLRTKFEHVTGAPLWATKREDDAFDIDGDSDAEDLMRATGDSLMMPQTLPKGTIELKRCTNANQDSPHGAKLRCVEFHPSAQVILTAGMDYRLSLFQVDGKMNPLIQSTYFTKYPIHTAHFSHDGREVIVGSIHANFFYYDMMAGKVVKVPKIKAIEETCMRYFEVSPDGNFIAFRGKSGFIHLISGKSKEWISSLKMNGTVAALSFSADGRRLYSHGDDGEVYVWDMTTRDCLHRFYDQGCIHGTCVTVSTCGRYLACGSNTGVVNVYDTEICSLSTQPRPMKAVMNLTTKCTSLRFNSTSEILAMASNMTERGVKLLHMPSLSVFSNFPDRFTDRDIRIPLCLDISLNSGFLSIGSHNGTALLYRVKHYSNY